MTLRTLLPILMMAGFAFPGTQTNLNVGNRTAIVVAPSGYDNPPLVISMHGIGIPASWNQTMMKFESYADTARDKFIVVYPQAEGGSWDLNGDKDVKFILAIIDSMSNRYRIDRNRVYASGFSMGGMMSWYLSCKIPDKIAAIVPGNGYPLGGMSGCSEVRHVPALQIHGTADDFVSYSGFVTKFLPSQLSRYGCPATAARTKPYPVNRPTSKSFLDAWNPCTKNGLTSEISLLSVDGMIHDWATPGKLNASDDPNYKGKPFDVDGTAEAWNWMKRHSLTGSTPVVTVPAHRDTIFNGRFGSSAVGWSFNVWGGSALGGVVNGEYKAEITEIGANNHDIQLIQNGLVLEQGKSYEVTFDAYSTSIRTMEANVEKDTDPWTSYLPGPRSFNLTTVKTPYSYTFTMTQPTDSNGRVSFNLGASTGSVLLDNISIQPGKPTSIHAAKHRGGSVRIVRSGASRLQVEFGAPHGTAISLGLFDLSGRLVRSARFLARSGAVQSWSSDLSGLPGGVYVLGIDIGGEAEHRSSFVLGD